MSKKLQASAGDIGSYADGVYVLPSKVTHAQAPALAAALLQAANKGKGAQAALSLDASALREFDSSLLVALMQLYRTAGAQAEIRHAPAQLLELIKVYGLEEVMPTSHLRAEGAEKFASPA